MKNMNKAILQLFLICYSTHKFRGTTENID
jgi:hypothetical protein